MRPKYPVSHKEMLVELQDLQETLISLIGYDQNAFDDAINVSGSIDILDATITASGSTFLSDRLYREINPDYMSLYRNNLVLYIARRSIND